MTDEGAPRPPVTPGRPAAPQQAADPPWPANVIPGWAMASIADEGGDDPAAMVAAGERFLARYRAVTAGVADASDADLASLANDQKAGSWTQAAARTELGVRHARTAELPDYAGAPVSGVLSTQPLTENGWGFDPGRPVSYHEDGPIGCAVQWMGDTARIDFDGRPLGDVLGTVATDVVAQRRTPAEALAVYQTILDRLPPGTAAHEYLGGALRAMQGRWPALPEIPATTPAPIGRLMADLYAIPMVRGAWSKDLDKLADIARRYETGELRGGRLGAALSDITHHESYGEAGKFQIDAAVARCRGEMDLWERQQRTRRAAESGS